MLKILKYIAPAFVVLMLAFFVKVDLLVVYDKQQKKEHLIAPLFNEREFCVRFTHSVALTPVDECFAAENEIIVLKRTIYEDFGAGLPHEAFSGQTMSFKDGKIVIEGFSLKIPILHIRVGRIAKHSLQLPAIFSEGLTDIRLDSFVKPGNSLELSIKKSTIAESLLKNWSALFIKL